MLCSLAGFEWCEQWQTAWPHYLRHVSIRINGDEIVFPGRFSLQKILKPPALLRNVVDHQIEHQLVFVFHTALKSITEKPSSELYGKNGRICTKVSSLLRCRFKKR